jgi:hypothetical protein
MVGDRTVGDPPPHYEITATAQIAANPLYKDHEIQRIDLIHHGEAPPKSKKHYPTHQNPAYTTLRD